MYQPTLVSSLTGHSRSVTTFEVLRNVHTCLIESVFNDNLRIITGCLRPTQTDNLPFLAGIQTARLFLTNRSILDPDQFA